MLLTNSCLNFKLLFFTKNIYLMKSHDLILMIVFFKNNFSQFLHLWKFEAVISVIYSINIEVNIEYDILLYFNVNKLKLYIPSKSQISLKTIWTDSFTFQNMCSYIVYVQNHQRRNLYQNRYLLIIWFLSRSKEIFLFDNCITYCIIHSVGVINK